LGKKRTTRRVVVGESALYLETSPEKVVKSRGEVPLFSRENPLKKRAAHSYGRGSPRPTGKKPRKKSSLREREHLREKRGGSLLKEAVCLNVGGSTGGKKDFCIKKGEPEKENGSTAALIGCTKLF